MARLLLILPTTTYRVADFIEAAARLGAEVTVASERSSTLEAINPAGLLRLDLDDPQTSAAQAAAFASVNPVDGVVGVDDDAVLAAAAIAERLALAHNPMAAVRAARHKATFRRVLSEARLAQPQFRVHQLGDDPRQAARELPFPVVLKPTFLAASRGVIRADDVAEFAAAWRRIAALLGRPEIAQKGGDAAREILVEEFIPGDEVSLEGLLDHAALSTLALFDKPDPLLGPYFEETIYVTPSRHPETVQTSVTSVTSRACGALGLQTGPIHAELRLTPDGPVVLEIAPRSIGGLCSRTLRFGTGMSLEDIILRQALGYDVSAVARQDGAAGVMMIPVPASGILDRVEGLDQARAIPGIVEVTITAHSGQRLVPLPEGSQYPGFIFSRAETPAAAEAALRQAHSKLKFVMEESGRR